MSVVFDSSALLAIVFQEDGAEAAARRLSGGIVSAVNASEVIARLVDFGTSSEDARNALLNFGLDIRPFDAVLAVAAGQLRAVTREKGLSRLLQCLRIYGGSDPTKTRPYVLISVAVS